MNAEEWLKKSVEILDKELFNGDLDLLNHPYQISWGRCKGSKNTETVQPSDNENITLQDFFPTTIAISYTVNEPQMLLTNIAYECIHAFFNEKKCNKRFKELAKKYYFEAPYSKCNASEFLKEIIERVYNKMLEDFGEFPNKAVKFPEKDKKQRKKHKYIMFCPSCGYEVTVSDKTLKKYGNGSLTCVCGNKMGIDLSDEEQEKEADS